MSDAPNPTTSESEAQPAETLPPDALEDLRARAAKADDHWDRLVRISADFDNFKKRAARERDEVRRNATESVITRLLSVVDNFDMALAAANQPNITIDTLKAGVVMIHSQLRSTLSELGLEEVHATGQTFDPALHEAVAHEDSTAVPEGQVIRQTRKGYRLRDRLLRPATVIVARTPGSEPPAA